jgi:hypothetical protein
MSRRRRLGGLALATAIAIAGAGCASVASQTRPGVAPPPAPSPPGLATSVVNAGGTWAVAVLGGSAASDNNFWQLFVRPAGSAAWRLATPPGVASNGGMVVASPGGRSLIAGFRPSQDLVFSPLASTVDDGASWAGGVLDAALANVPGALAATPGGGRLLALLSNGEIEQGGQGGAGWARLTSLRSLAATPAGRRCAPAALTAVAFAPSGTGTSGPGTSSGTPEAAASCTHPGTTGIFAAVGGTWQAAGPALPAQFADWRVQVLLFGPSPANASSTSASSASALSASASPTGASSASGSPAGASSAGALSAGTSSAGASSASASSIGDAAVGGASAGGASAGRTSVGSTPSGQVVLLAARSGRSTDLFAAWSTGTGGWTVSAPLDAGAVQASGLPAGGAAVRAVGLGAAGAAWVLLADGQADTIAGPGPGPQAGFGAGL